MAWLSFVDRTWLAGRFAGNSVGIDARSLTIESQLDTQKAKADQFNVSGQIGFGNTGVSGTVQEAKGDAVLVSEQSGIHAGTGGVDIDSSGQISSVIGRLSSQASPSRVTASPLPRSLSRSASADMEPAQATNLFDRRE